MKIRILATLFALGLICPQAKAQFALKTNLLYWATTTPNLGAELAVSRERTIQVLYGMNPWKSTATPPLSCVRDTK